MKQSEKSIEQSFLRMMKKAYPRLRIPKLTMLSQRSWPDRFIPLHFGRCLFIEFKRKGGSPIPLQEECHDYLRRMGHDVQVFDDARAAYDYVCGKLESVGDL